MSIRKPQLYLGQSGSAAKLIQVVGKYVVPPNWGDHTPIDLANMQALVRKRPYSEAIGPYVGLDLGMIESCE